VINLETLEAGWLPPAKIAIRFNQPIRLLGVKRLEENL